MNAMNMRATIPSNRVALPRRARTVNPTRAALAATPAGLDVYKMSPMGDRLLVKPKEAETQSAGGVLLTTTTAPSMQEALVGTVLAVGDEVEITVKVGDRVLYTKYGTSDVSAEDGDVSFVAQKSVLAILS